MWNKGILNIDGTEVKYWAKVLNHKSEDYGIEGGRIIKMSLKINDEWTLNYDRGWDIEPEDEASQLAYMVLLNKFA